MTSTNIVFAQSKGGAGKTTTGVELANELSRRWKVTLLDSDPNAPVHNWAKAWLKKKGDEEPDPKAIKVGENLMVVKVERDESLVEAIERAGEVSDFVVTDTEGVADLRVAQAIAMSDFVVIPSQGSALDQAGVVQIVRLLKEQERITRRSIPHAVVFTRANPAIRTKDMATAEEQLAARGIEIFETRMIDRGAYRAVFSFRKTLDTLDPSKVSNIDKAKENSRAFAREVISRLKAIQEGQDGRQARSV